MVDVDILQDGAFQEDPFQLHVVLFIRGNYHFAGFVREVIGQLELANNVGRLVEPVYLTNIRKILRRRSVLNFVSFLIISFTF
jgi:hypothetical protein